MQRALMVENCTGAKHVDVENCAGAKCVNGGELYCGNVRELCWCEVH